MALHIALLRGINVGGHGTLPMAALRDMLAGLGFADVRTLLQSGNAVFAGGTRTGAALERYLEAETEKRFKHRPDYFVRTQAEWRAIVAANPFKKEAKSDPGRLVVMALKEAPARATVDALRAAIKGRETFRAHGRELYIYYPDGQGTSKFTGTLIEKTLSTRGTARNWNTVTKLAALAGA